VNPSDGDIFTLPELTLYLNAGKKTVYRVAQHGEIPGFTLGRTSPFPRSELDRWVSTQIAKNTSQNISDSKVQSDAAALPGAVAARS
jgi:excisionase family DNA binding protein